MTELLSAAANKDAYRTLRDDGAASVSDLEPVAPPKKSFGKRGFAPLYQWEGVVEEVNGEGFRARLVPFENGQADPSRVEYADFEYDDLADESDRELVTHGAVFYWTVGRGRDSGGSISKRSLVRFRRLPPTSPYHAREARREAEDLLSDLGAD